MKRLTYAELEAEKERLSKDAGLYFLALTLSFRQKPDAVANARAEGIRFTFKLWGSTRADGGIVTETQALKGQLPLTTAHYLEDLQRSTAYHGIGNESPAVQARRSAMYSLLEARNKLLNTANAA